MKKYTIKFKEIIIKEYKNGTSYKEIKEKYNVPKTCLYDWLKLYSIKVHKDEKIFTYKQYEDLQKKFEKVSRELEIIKLSHCFADSPRKQKEEAIEKLMDKFPVKEMCRVLNLPTGTFYNYHLRRVKITQNQIRDEYLKSEILKIFNESGQRFGAPKITAKLSTLGIKTTKSKVSNLMKQMNIKSKQCKKRTFEKSQGKLPYCKNYLKREFKQTAPNKFWVGDITAIFIKNNKFYLCVILDLFSRKVIAYRLSSQNNNNLSINTFKDAFEIRNHPTNLCFHSDQGTNYTSHEYRNLLKALKVKQSFSSKANPYDNAVVESFFSNFKREEINHHSYEYFEELQESVKEYMNYYNDYRPHSSLKNKTPNQVENDYKLNVLAELSV